MDKETKEFFSKSVVNLPSHWTIDEQSKELGRWAIESGLAELPEYDEEGFDRAVEDAYEFYRGEALAFLKGEA